MAETAVQEQRAESTLRLNPLLETYPFDGDNREDMVLCEVPTEEGGRRRFTMPARILETLELFKGGRTPEEVRKRLEQTSDLELDWTKIEDLITGYFLPKRLLVEEGSSDLRAEPKGSRADYMFLRVPVFPAGIVRTVGRALTWLFRRPVAIPVLAAVAAGQAVFYLLVEPAHSLEMADLHGTDAVWLGILMALSSVTHEFGHAAAAVRYGCEDLEIGWGWYLHLSVLYTDLSEVWKLPRRQRAVVDAGGMYFQGIFVTVLLLLFATFREPVLLYCILFTGLSVTGALNPFLRLDGYWLVSDLCGIPNLRRQSERFITSLGKALAGENGGLWSDLDLGLSRRARLALAAYAVVSSVFFVFLFLMVVDRVVLGLVQRYPETVMTFVETLRAGDGILGVGGALFDLAWRAVAIFAVGRYGLRMLRRLWRGLQSAWRWMAARRSGRAAAESA